MSLGAPERILILDFGSQYTQLIARRVRAAGVYCDVQPCDCEVGKLSGDGTKGFILSGGPESTVAEGAPRIPDVVFGAGVPVLGICYGMQAMARHFGGQVSISGMQEFGHARLQPVDEPDLFFADFTVTENADVWMSHGDKVTELPEGFRCLATSPGAPIAAMVHCDRPLYGVQFHPEVTHTPSGQQLIENFVLKLCGCRGDWTAGTMIEPILEMVRTRVGTDQVILGLSGGVDSSVAAALLDKAIGEQLHCLLIDNGLLRLGEGEAVVDWFKTHSAGLNVRRIDARADFMQALLGVTDPEEKRKIIGKTFISVFERAAAELPQATWLAQGTIYSDVIESAASQWKKPHAIKSHHNVGGLPEKMALQLLEPIRDLFKDEVRQVGRTLGLPDGLIDKHPFPGPGLGVRIVGEVTEEKADLLRHIDAIFLDELRKAGFYDKVSQAFAVLLPVKSVGVVGDSRRYTDVVSLRAVTTVDFMTARFAELPHDLLSHIATRIINEAPQISRVLYDISSKPPATIEWE